MAPVRTKLSRRGFLRGALAATLTPIPGWSLHSGIAQAGECELTTTDIEGPYYVEDPPWRTVIASEDEAGIRFFMRGTVYASDCDTPLEGAIVDVWQANDAGCYSVLENCPDEDPMNLRGQMLTDENGEYAFESIYPANYGSRPSHVHYRVSAPAEGTNPLVTQLYFEGDPFLETDPWSSDPRAANRIIPLSEDENGLHGVFDIHLGQTPSDYEDPTEYTPDAMALFQNYPNPVRDRGTTIRYQTHREERVDLAIFDVRGRRVKTLVDRPQAASYHSVDWDGRDDRGLRVATGIYLYRLRVGSVERVQKLVVG